MRSTSQLILAFVFFSTAMTTHCWAENQEISRVKKLAEEDVRRVLDPLIERYCKDQCKLLSIKAEVDLMVPDEVTPGFEDLQTESIDLAASQVTATILVDQMLGPNTLTNLTELLRTHLDGLDFPVILEKKIAHFPQPLSSAARVIELKRRLSTEFKETLESLFNKFCPDRCILADFNLQAEAVNLEEAQYGSTDEFIQEGDTAIKIKGISAKILMDQSLSPVEQSDIIEMARLKTSRFKNVDLSSKSLSFPQPGKTGGRGIASSSGSNDSRTSSSSSSETEQRQEKLVRIEKIERVENGDAVQKKLDEFQFYALIFGCSLFGLIILLYSTTFLPSKPKDSVQRIVQSLASDSISSKAPSTYLGGSVRGDLSKEDQALLITKRYQIEDLKEQLMKIFAEQPRVAKFVFTKVLTEEGVEITSQYLDLFGESVVMDMLKDPSIQSDLAELMDFYAKNPMDLTDDEKLDLLKKLYNRTVAAKLAVMGNRSSNLFDFLMEMDALQILDLMKGESLTVKAVVLTQIDAQKRTSAYSKLDADTRMRLLTELSRIDHLPRDYIFNISQALKRKRTENPRLNTESLPGSEVLVSLLERTGHEIQRSVVKSLESSNPDSARNVKNKLVSIETLTYLRDQQLLEVILSLRHEELLTFLKGTTKEIKATIFSKAPKELVQELEEDITSLTTLSREGYHSVERKIINRVKTMANDGILNLIEVNERMFGVSSSILRDIAEAAPAFEETETRERTVVKRAAGW